MAGHEGRIGGFKAFTMGLPTRIDSFIWQLLLVITLAMMLAPALITAIIRHVRKGQGCDIQPRFGLATRGMSVFLAYLFIISPAMLRQSCQAAYLTAQRALSIVNDILSCEKVKSQLNFQKV